MLVQAPIACDEAETPAAEDEIASAAESVCILDLAEMPDSWRPSEALRPRLSDKPWSRAEQRESSDAVRGGYKEMADYLAEDPKRITKLGMNSVEVFLDLAYSAGNLPELQSAALETAAKNILVLAGSHLKSPPSGCEWKEVRRSLRLVNFAHSLATRMPNQAEIDSLEGRLTAQTNHALKDCGSLSQMVGFEPSELFKRSSPSLRELRRLRGWTSILIDALANPALELPAGTEAFIGEMWAYVSRLDYPRAKDFAEGANNSFFYRNAYLVTHFGYIASGYGRYQIYVDDGPWIFRFLRENFYAVMEMGELDLLAEFVELFRQYGCTEEDDRQVRDGARYLLQLYRRAGGKWMAHLEPWQEASPDHRVHQPYRLVHKPWCAVAGLRWREFEPVMPGNYGDIFQKAVRSPDTGPSRQTP